MEGRRTWRWSPLWAAKWSLLRGAVEAAEQGEEQLGQDAPIWLMRAIKQDYLLALS